MNGLGRGISFGLCLLALATFAPTTVRGDGMVIPQRAYALPEISDQRALVHYNNGMETLVIETSFAGKGTNFAWVVPLPAEAKIEPASTGLFPTLQIIFQPKIVLSVSPYWLALPIAALLIFLIRLLDGNAFGVLALLALIFLAALFLLPALGPAGSRAGPAGSTMANVRVLNRQNAGLFDTVTLKSTDPSALLAWLNSNGFSAPTNISPVVADYVREGWVFAAARLRRETGDNTPQATHPLAFTFKTPKPVYPLRLTGQGTASCRIDLYVFGPGRAAARGFTVQRCEAPTYATQATTLRLEGGGLRIRHEELAKLVAGAPVATRLSAALDPSGMTRDAYLNWNAYWPSGRTRYTAGAALTVSGNVAALLFMGLVATWWVLSQSRRITETQAQQWRGWLAPLALVAGVAVYVIGLPQVSASSLRVTRASASRLRADVYGLAQETAIALVEPGESQTGQTQSPPSTSRDWDRLFPRLLRDYETHGFHSRRGDHPLTNFFTGEAIRLEASPGNVIIRPAGGKSYHLVWHDLDGAEAITRELPGEF